MELLGAGSKGVKVREESAPRRTTRRQKTIRKCKGAGKLVGSFYCLVLPSTSFALPFPLTSVQLMKGKHRLRVTFDARVPQCCLRYEVFKCDERVC